MNRIELFLDLEVWYARFSGPHESEMLRLFHTATVPTAFTHNAKPEFVLTSIQKMNPGVQVEIAQDVAA